MAVVISATILIVYGVLGFLDGYVTTNVWYGKRIDKERLPPDAGAALQKLAGLHGSGLLSDAEFTAKRAEIIGRI